MNLYIRYFDEETVVRSADEAYEFLCHAVGERLEERHLEMLRDYMSSNASYTKRFKVKPRIYYVAIKTEAGSLEVFKKRGQEMKHVTDGDSDRLPSVRTRIVNHLAEEREGWYEGRLLFKRVVFCVDTGKNEYVDTEFVAKVRAKSPQHLYDRLCEHLMNRPDLDPRSQMPSAKGRNFQYKFLEE